MYGIYRYLNVRSFDIHEECHEEINGIARKFFTGESEIYRLQLFTVLSICERVIAIFSFRFLKNKN